MTGSSNRLTGGCQCGALRYEWLEKPAHSSVCYCRMCQKASGQPFMASGRIVARLFNRNSCIARAAAMSADTPCFYGTAERRLFKLHSS